MSDIEADETTKLLPKIPPSQLTPANSDSNRDVTVTPSSIVFQCIGWMILIIFFPIAIWWSFLIVREYERAVVLRLGRMLTKIPRGPGLVFKLPVVDKVRVIDLRTHVMDVVPQEILTKDSMNMHVNAVVFYRIVNPYLAVLNVVDPRASTALLATSILRNVLGALTMYEILTDNSNLKDLLKTTLDEVTYLWGVKIELVEIKDIRIPQDMKRSMAAEAEASREAKAKQIMAQGEWEASKNLRAAADILENAPGSLQLRYLQTLNLVAGEKNHTYIFPLPIDLLQDLFKKIA